LQYRDTACGLSVFPFCTMYTFMPVERHVERASQHVSHTPITVSLRTAEMVRQRGGTDPDALVAPGVTYRFAAQIARTARRRAFQEGLKGVGEKPTPWRRTENGRKMRWSPRDSEAGDPMSVYYPAFNDGAVGDSGALNRVHVNEALKDSKQRRRQWALDNEANHQRLERDTEWKDDQYHQDMRYSDPEVVEKYGLGELHRERTPAEFEATDDVRPRFGRLRTLHLEKPDTVRQLPTRKQTRRTLRKKHQAQGRWTEGIEVLPHTRRYYDAQEDHDVFYDAPSPQSSTLLPGRGRRRVTPVPEERGCTLSGGRRATVAKKPRCRRLTERRRRGRGRSR
jgi:hypothetical protein